MQEQEVYELIKETTGYEYIGKLRILNDGNMWQLLLYFDREYTPTVFAMEGTETEFKKFLRHEFKTRKMEKTRYYKIVREPFVDLTDWDDE